MGKFEKEDGTKLEDVLEAMGSEGVQGIRPAKWIYPHQHIVLQPFYWRKVNDFLEAKYTYKWEC